jgi:hypothetical protein
MSYAEFCALFHEHVDRYPPMPPKLNCKRAALFVLTKIDEILRWEKQKEVERNTRFVELFIASALGSDPGLRAFLRDIFCRARAPLPSKAILRPRE